MTKEANTALTKLRGRATDEFNCFNIRDFRKHDSVITTSSLGERIKAVVESVDLKDNLIHLRTVDGELVTHIGTIAFLDSYRDGWLA